MKATDNFEVLYRLCYPPKVIQLLQTVALADRMTAQRAWDEWKQLDRLNDIGWQEQKLLAQIYSTIVDLDPDYVHLPRIGGFLKSEWTKTQMRLKKSLAALDILLEAGFEVMIFKGLAYQKQTSSRGIRLSGDLDILVKEQDFIAAIQLLHTSGWSGRCGDLVTDNLSSLEQLPASCHAIGVMDACGGEFDVHRRPLRTQPQCGYLAGLWQRSTQGEFMGRSVRFCSRADYLALLVAHGVSAATRSEDISGVWITDFVSALIPGDTILADKIMAIVIELRKSLEYATALHYGAEVLKSADICALRQHVGDIRFTLGDVIRYSLNSPSSFERWTPVWWVAGSLRRRDRYYRLIKAKFNMIFRNKKATS